MGFTGQEDHFITFEQGAEMTKRYRDQMKPGDIKGGYIGRDAMLTLINQQDCVGFRYYYGLNEHDQQEVVFVGVDSIGNDIIGTGNYCLDKAAPCPQNCGSNNILNSD